MNSIYKRSTIFVRPIINKAISSSCINNKSQKTDFDNIINPEGHEPSIPPYVEREGENLTLKKSRLLYQSRKRGMLENGLLLSTFAKKYLDSFDENQVKLYDRLINLPSNDWDIFHWATNIKPTPPEFDNEIMDLLKKHIKNENREARITQPDL
ncbi:succinate dehydrogenase assembly factor 2, mitochondrial-like [Leptopilina boulardi]|uniref:succinate dehydrogenase assembly factor 2, mitochondrial-like n=1 Tax=Leptopilina boulardi TaxID=63433 RepID=UPI0021F51FA4|nr:succinate dehydrogenase assembly factor 2, mitochondrial-like [Leptopilina boulardi]